MRNVELTEDEEKELEAVFDQLFPFAASASNNDTVRQSVVTYGGCHWIGIWRRSIEDILEDRWTLKYHPILKIIVECVDINDPYCTNVEPCIIKNGEEYYINDEDCEDEE